MADTDNGGDGLTPRAPADERPPKNPNRDPAKLWQNRLTSANKDYDKWADDYNTRRLLDYYLGKHWHFLSDTERKHKYVINLIFATVENQLPSLMFTRPRVKVEARPDHADTPGSDAPRRAELIQRALQTFIDDPRLHFTFQTGLALKETYWRFGMVEVGYSADYIDNPNADKPVLKEDGETPLLDDDKRPVLEAKRVLKKGGRESLYVKRIAAETVRVWPGRNVLEENDWVAYFDWFPIEDVKANKDFKNTARLQATGAQLNDAQISDDPDHEKHKGMVRVWKIFDLRARVRHILADGHPKLLQEGRPFKTFPLTGMKFYEILDSYYPLPPLFNWTSPQDEINESREQQKVHRRRFNRRYMRTPQVKPDEFEKLESGEDGVCIEVPSVEPPPIRPIEDAPLDATNWTQLAATKEDLTVITGLPGEARGTPEAETATQANIVNVRAQIREASSRTVVGEWLAQITRLMLLTIREKMQGPLLVKRSLDITAPPSPEGVADAKAWEQVKLEDIDALEVDISVDVEQLSPIAEQQASAAWDMVLQIVAQPATAAFLMQDDPEAPNQPSPILRRWLTLKGIKSDADIRSIWRIGKAALAAQAAAATAQAKIAHPIDKPHASWSFKGEDLSDPLVRQAFIQAEGLQAFQQALDAAAQAAAQTVPPPGGPTGGSAAPLVPQPPQAPVAGHPATAGGPAAT